MVVQELLDANGTDTDSTLCTDIGSDSSSVQSDDREDDSMLHVISGVADIGDASHSAFADIDDWGNVDLHAFSSISGAGKMALTGMSAAAKAKLSNFIGTGGKYRPNELSNQFHERLENVEQRFHRRINRIKERAGNAKAFAEEELLEVREEIRHIRRIAKSSVKSTVKKLKNPKHMRLRDKAAYMLGVVNVVVMTGVACGWPHLYHLYHAIATLILIPTRLVQYKLVNWHYFLLDFCYYANAILLASLWCFNDSPRAFTIAFGFSCGPLLWAVAAFRNSLVFHSLDKCISAFIHISPPLCAALLRFIPNSKVNPEERVPFFEYMWQSFAVYLVWAVLYYIKVFVFSLDKVKDGRRLTLFTWLMDSSSVVRKICFRFQEHTRPLVFIAGHAVFFNVCIAVSWLLYHSMELTTTIVLVMAALCVWNGGNFYFEVFARRYESELVKSLAKHSNNVAEGAATSPKSQ